MSEPVIVFAVLGLALLLFAAGRWRYDLVALMALLAVTLTGIVPASEAFAGFGHPAVVTVAAVLIVSRGLMASGVVDLVARWIAPVGTRSLPLVGALTALVALCSGFMNNVGALALLMPVALRLARKNELSPSVLLMPLAFASLLGGMTTLIGTPPNIIIATFRAQNGGGPFRMFDFTPVGAGILAAGLLFIVLVGWRWIPLRKGQASREQLFHVQDYLTEVRVPEGSSLVGRELQEVEGSSEEGELLVVGVVRGNRRLAAPSPFQTLKAEDVLIIEGSSEALRSSVEAFGLELVGSEELAEEKLSSEEVVLSEAVVVPGGFVEGRTARSLSLRRRFGVNLLAVARQGARLNERLERVRFRAGDVLLLQADREGLGQTLSTLGCLPLAERDLQLGKPRRLALALGIFAAAVAAAATGLLPIEIAMTTAALSMILIGLLSLREAYDAIDWPILILLGAMIPVGIAFETSGAAELVARKLLDVSSQAPPALGLGLILVGTMFLSDLVNNAAAAVLMAPIAVSVAQGLGASADPFLMAVAVGASCAFLTPIGHQSNTLVMGPGGYRFGDYWRMGLPLEILIVAVGIPLILIVWPLGVAG